VPRGRPQYPPQFNSSEAVDGGSRREIIYNVNSIINYNAPRPPFLGNCFSSDCDANLRVTVSRSYRLFLLIY
jgi:hypothetical protein